MRIVAAPDSFKESMSAGEAAAALARGVRAVVPDAVVDEVPMADGGEGFVSAVAAALDAEERTVPVADTLGRTRRAALGLAGDLAVIEVAQAVGLQDVEPADRDLWRSTSAGVGDLIRAALDAGARRLVVGLGGSATNDGGAGMLAALGARLLDEHGAELAPTPDGLRALARVDRSGLDPRLADISIEAACDVDNPLCGERGASAIFGPQKGAGPDDVPALDSVLGRLAELAGPEHADAPGAGAAGGLGWAMLTLGASMRPGVELVADLVGLAERVAGADLVLTGEGSVDAQTLAGKTPAGVAKVAAAHGVPTVVLAGRVAPDADVLLAHGVTALVPIVPAAMDLPEALRTGPENLERAAATVLRLWTRGVR